MGRSEGAGSARAPGGSGGVEVWATRFELPRLNDLAGSRRIRDERSLRKAIGPLVNRYGRWPTNASVCAGDER